MYNVTIICDEKMMKRIQAGVLTFDPVDPKNKPDEFILKIVDQCSNHELFLSAHFIKK